MLSVDLEFDLCGRVWPFHFATMLNQNPFSRRDLIKKAAGAGLGLIAVRGLPGRTKVSDAGNSTIDSWCEQLAKHKIEKIERRTVQNRWPRLVSRNSRKGVHGWGYKAQVALVYTDTGVMGWGLASGMGKSGASELTELYRGKAVTDLFNPALGTHDDVPKWIDLALHDLAGMILDLPVFVMIGGDEPKSVPCYSGMIYFDDIEPLEEPPGIEQVLFNAGADFMFGYRQMKIKVGRGAKWMDREAGLQRDIEVTNALAKAYPEVTFLADANDGYNVDETISYLDAIDTELLFMEEPFRENEADLAALRQNLDSKRLKTLIADGEDDPDAGLLDILIERDLLDVHLTDLYGLGFTNWRKLMPSLIKRGVQASPHTWGHRLKTVYTAHLSSGLGNVLTVEGVTAFSKDIDFSDYNPDERGNISPPDKPGFGLTLR